MRRRALLIVPAWPAEPVPKRARSNQTQPARRPHQASLAVGLARAQARRRLRRGTMRNEGKMGAARLGAGRTYQREGARGILPARITLI